MEKRLLPSQRKGSCVSTGPRVPRSVDHTGAQWVRVQTENPRKAMLKFLQSGMFAECLRPSCVELRCLLKILSVHVDK